MKMAILIFCALLLGTAYPAISQISNENHDKNERRDFDVTRNFTDQLENQASLGIDPVVSSLSRRLSFGAQAEKSSKKGKRMKSKHQDDSDSLAPTLSPIDATGR
jgi:hypothetical protein